MSKQGFSSKEEAIAMMADLQQQQQEEERREDEEEEEEESDEEEEDAGPAAAPAVIALPPPPETKRAQAADFFDAGGGGGGDKAEEAEPEKAAEALPEPPTVLKEAPPKLDPWDEYQANRAARLAARSAPPPPPAGPAPPAPGKRKATIDTFDAWGTAGAKATLDAVPDWATPTADEKQSRGRRRGGGGGGGGATGGNTEPLGVRRAAAAAPDADPDDFDSLPLDEKIARLNPEAAAATDGDFLAEQKARSAGAAAPPPPPPPPPLPRGVPQMATPPPTVGFFRGDGDGGDGSSLSSQLNRKIYVGGLSPDMTEDNMRDYFAKFGQVQTCFVIRDQATGISRGFGFITFREEEQAEATLMHGSHSINGVPLRVSPAQDNSSKEGQLHTTNLMRKYSAYRDGGQRSFADDVTVPEQTKIYAGPLGEEVIANDLTKCFTQFGGVLGVSRLYSSESLAKKSYGCIEFKDPIGVRRVFGHKIYIRDKHVRLACSRFAMEVVLSDNVMFFCEAHNQITEPALLQHFSQFGPVFKALHVTAEDGKNKIYGFVDFVSENSVELALKKRTQMISGQFVKLVKPLPMTLLADFLSISDKHGQHIGAQLEQRTPEMGVWGTSGIRTNAKFDGEVRRGNMSTSQVRVPTALLGAIMGERGKKVAEVARDSKCRVQIPKHESNEANVVITITGLKDDIKVAQYLMQSAMRARQASARGAARPQQLGGYARNR